MNEPLPAILFSLTLGLTGACNSLHPTIHDVSGKVGVQRHIEEFSQGVQTYARDTEAPDGSGRVAIDKHAQGLWGGNQGWHTLWLERGETPQRRKILTLREGDPGSGPSFSFRWSRDSKAIFIWGWYSGCECTGLPSSGEDLRLIYTIDDGKLWNAAFPAG